MKIKSMLDFSPKVKVKVTQLCPTLCNPQTIQSMEFSRPENWGGQSFPSPGDFLNPGIEPRSPVLQADSLPAKPQGKPKNTGVASPSLFQQIFLTQESNWGLLHCRRVLYQLSYQGSPQLCYILQFFFKQICQNFQLGFQYQILKN